MKPCNKMAAYSQPKEKEIEWSQYCKSDREWFKECEHRGEKRHYEEVREAFQDLENQMTEQGNKEKGFSQWCQIQGSELISTLTDSKKGRKFVIPPTFYNQYKTALRKDLEGASIYCSNLQESDIRGDEAHRKVFRAFQLLSFQEEKRGQSDMYMLSGILYENVMSWPMKTSKVDDIDWDVNAKTFPQAIPPSESREEMEKNPGSRYFKIPSDFTEGKKSRHEGEITIMHSRKGFVLVQVKATAFGVKCKVEKFREKIENCIDQLNIDGSVLQGMISNTKRKVIPTKVVALPNVARKDIPKDYTTNPDLVFLCQEDLENINNDIKVPEAKTDISKFQKWWRRLPDREIKEDVIREVLAKYVGKLSTVTSFNESNARSRVYTIGDAIYLTARLFRRLVFNKQQIDILQLKKVSRVCLCGPPGCGKTMLLLKKGVCFAKEDSKHRVFVLDIYRGAKGRAIGRFIQDELKNTLQGNEQGASIENTPKKEQVTYMDVDTDNTNSDLDKLLSCQQSDLILIDELPPLQYCGPVLEKLTGTNCHIWCAASIFGEMPSILDMVEQKLTKVMRCPPSVQCVMYHTDWDDDRKSLYTKDSCPDWMPDEQKEIKRNPNSVVEGQEAKQDKQKAKQDKHEAAETEKKACTGDGKVKPYQDPTNGTIPLCIRHKTHDQTIRIIDCRRCAQNLSKLFDKIHFEHSSDESPIPYFRVTILMNIPKELYKKTERGESYETFEKSLKDYFKRIEHCPFIQELQKSVDVDVVTELDSNECFDKYKWFVKIDENYVRRNKVVVTWLESFQGLEDDVVIFLPGDLTSSDGSSDSKEWTIVPGFSRNSEHQFSQIQQNRTNTSATEEATEFLLSSCHWDLEDIARFNSWDKQHLFLAASRCSAQLILLVP